jgi:uncharacterized membrane protein
MDDVTLARAVHVLAVIHWMGGVAFVTAVVLPERKLALFEAVERRFSAQVKVSVPLVGLSGAYMAERLDIWHRFVEPAGWWLAAMALLWLLFMVILFVVEPLLARDWFERQSTNDPSGTIRLLQRAHWILLTAGAVVSAAAVLGAHGLLG